MSDLVPTSLMKRLDASFVSDHAVEKLKEGETPLAVAEWIQDDLLEFTSETRQDLAHAVKQVFIDRVDLIDRLDLAREGGSAIEKSVRKQKRASSTFEELQRLYFLQMARIDLAHQGELDSEKTIGSLGNDVEIARRIAMNIHEVEMDLGGAGRPSNEARGGLTQSMKQKLGKAIKNLLDSNEEPIDADFHVIDEATDDADRAEGPDSDVPGDSPA